MGPSGDKYFLQSNPSLKKLAAAYPVNGEKWLKKLQNHEPKNPKTKVVWQRNIKIFETYFESNKRMVEIAQENNLSTERVSQIIEQILRRINFWEIRGTI